jgi:exonuclease SbcD
VRILHTADWHVGKTLGGRSRAAEHQAVLAEIAAIARRERVELTLVAGDLFDSVSPGPEAERIVYGALLELGRQAPVVVVPGNHDNEHRLAAIAPVLALAGIIVRSSVSAELVEVESHSGETARIAPLPWLSQRFVIKADQLMSRDADQLSGQFAERMRRVLAAITAGFHDEGVNLVIGHVTIAGGTLGGGERTAQTIFDYWVPPTAFPAAAHYVALGHLHRMQRMPAACPVQYSGSPLQLDFSDVEDSKHVLLVEASAGRPARVEPVELTSGRCLRTLSGSLAELAATAGTTGEDYLRVRVREPARAGLADEVRDLFSDNVVKILVEADPGHPSEASEERRRTMPARELFARYLSDRGVADDRMLGLFDRLYEELHETPAA